MLSDWELPHIDLWAAFPTGRRPSAKARAFAAFVEEQLRRRLRSRPSPRYLGPTRYSGKE